MAFLKKYPNFSLNEDEVKAKVAELLIDVSKYETIENFKTIFSLIDLTSLNSFDTSKSIDFFIDQLNSFSQHYPKYQNVAAICVYPPFISQIKAKLNPETEVKIASVAASFPSSQTYLEIKKSECELLVQDGADELDIVISLRLFLDKNYNKVIEEIKAIKEICGTDKHLKVILETGVLKSPKLIYEASLLSMEAGADYIKTSTGKLDPAATLEAVYVMCQAINEYNDVNDKIIGLKAAGGISNCEEAVKYFVLIKKMLGDRYLNKGLFRIGASKLANNILSKIEGSNISYFGERVLKNNESITTMIKKTSNSSNNIVVENSAKENNSNKKEDKTNKKIKKIVKNKTNNRKNMKANLAKAETRQNSEKNKKIIKKTKSLKKIKRK